MAKKLYETLGVEDTATKSEIKKAYRKLSKVYHPDKGGDADKFRDINEAYNILSDDKMREAYDNGTELSELKEESDGLIRRTFSIFEEVLNSAGFVPEYSNLFVKMRELCNEKYKICDEEIERFENQIRNVEDIQRRLKNAEIFVNYLDGEIDMFKHRIDNMIKEKEYIDRVLEFIEKCDYEINEEEDDEHEIPPRNYIEQLLSSKQKRGFDERQTDDEDYEKFF